MTTSDLELVEQLEHVWGSLEELGDALDEREWKTETECPGWSVQDNLAHIIGIESNLLGRPAPVHEPSDVPHVKNDLGARNEVWVDAYRTLSGAEMLAEFRAVTGERLAALHASGYDFGAESWTPVGPGTVRDLLPFRVFDSWVHEQDMRRAAGWPGDFDSAVAPVALDRVQAVMPMAVGKKVGPPDGTTVVFVVTGPAGREFALRMEAGRAARVDSIPPDPTVRLELDGETFLRLGAGRGDPAAILESGAVACTGDVALGRAIAEQMNFLF